MICQTDPEAARACFHGLAGEAITMLFLTMVLFICLMWMVLLLLIALNAPFFRRRRYP